MPWQGTLLRHFCFGITINHYIILDDLQVIIEYSLKKDRYPNEWVDKIAE